MNFIKQYLGLKRELYILFIGRIANTMGQMVWSTMTLILSNKLGFSAGKISLLLFVMLLLQLPFTYLGGKLADRTNKKFNIIICDVCVAICFIICGFLPISMITIWVFFLAGTFAMVESSSYEAITADLSTPEQRESAYSLTYLGMNLGFVIGPALSGLLFEKHLNLFFIICGLSTLFASALIFFTVRQESIDHPVQATAYESVQTSSSSLSVLKSNPVILYFIFLYAISQFIYYNFFFLLPINMESLYGATGAVYYGYMSSVNAIVVITMTSIMVRLFFKKNNFTKILIGESLIVLGLSIFIFSQHILWLCFASVVVFTLGEILTTVSKQPFVIARVPASHRGRIYAIMTVAATAFRAVLQIPVGTLADTCPLPVVWASITAIGVISLVLYYILLKRDQKAFPVLWENQKK